MKSHRFLAVLPLFLLLCGRAHATVGNNPTITVDENGVGSLLFPGGTSIPTHGVLAPDPGPGGLPSVLTYNLLGPPGLVAGDLLLIEPGSNLIEDVIRFNPAGTGGNPAYPASLVFYSDNIGGADSLGDTPSPPTAFYANTLVLPEVGSEDHVNGATYTPTANQPGFIPGFNVTYDITSDVPEPGSLALLATGGLPLLGFLRRRKLG
jgi:hypothetical protein